MGVPAGERSESSKEFINTAIDLQVQIERRCRKFPKSYRNGIASDIRNLGGKVCVEVQCGNGIWPTTQEEAAVRRLHFVEARGALNALVTQLDIAFNLFPLCGYKKDEKEIENWFLASRAEGDKSVFSRAVQEKKEKSADILKQLMGLIDTEKRLLDGLLSSDRKRWKNLPKISIEPD